MSKVFEGPDFIEDSDVPWNNVFREDFHVAVYYDKYPCTEGHLLFVPKFNSLFLKKSLEDRLKMSRDSLFSWLRSVKEAEVYQGVFRESLAKAAKRFYNQQSRFESKVDPHDSIVRTNSTVKGQDVHDGKELMDSMVEISSDPNVKTAEFDPG